MYRQQELMDAGQKMLPDRYLEDFNIITFIRVSFMLFNLSFFLCIIVFENRRGKKVLLYYVLTCYIIQYLEAIYVLMVHAVYPLRHNHLDSILVCNHSTPICVTTAKKRREKNIFFYNKKECLLGKKLQEKCCCEK